MRTFKPNVFACLISSVPKFHSPNTEKATMEFAQYVNCSGLEDAVLGFVQTESNSDERYAAIMSAFRKLAAFGRG